MSSQHSTPTEESNRDLIKRVRYELSLPVQSQFIREDVRKLANRLDNLEQQLESLRVALSFYAAKKEDGGRLARAILDPKKPPAEVFAHFRRLHGIDVYPDLPDSNPASEPKEA